MTRHCLVSHMLEQYIMISDNIREKLYDKTLSCQSHYLDNANICECPDISVDISQSYYHFYQ